MKGVFIVLEGPDGAGTTTQATLLAERLKKEGCDVLLTAEPTDGPIGKWIRLQLKDNTGLTPLSLQLLFCADRAWHIEYVIQPALEQGKIVVCDRYAPSTIVYAEAQEMETDMLVTLNNSFLQPDLQIFTLPPLEVSFERLQLRAEKEFFEARDLQSKIHDGYTRMATEDKSIAVVDTSQEKEASAQHVYDAAKRVLQ